MCAKVSPLYPGTGLPAVPAGGASEQPRPTQEAVMDEPLSVKVKCTDLQTETDVANMTS